MDIKKMAITINAKTHVIMTEAGGVCSTCDENIKGVGYIIEVRMSVGKTNKHRSSKIMGQKFCRKCGLNARKIIGENK